MTTTTPVKQTLYRTAVSRVNAVGIAEGDFVSIRHYHYDVQHGKHYYMTTKNDIDTGVVLPEHQLTRFCL